MNSIDSLRLISQFSEIIGILEQKWPRPQSGFETAILQMLNDMRETVRKEHEVNRSEGKVQ